MALAKAEGLPTMAIWSAWEKSKERKTEVRKRERDKGGRKEWEKEEREERGRKKEG